MQFDYEIEVFELFIERFDRLKQYKLSKTLLSEYVTSFTITYDLSKPVYWDYPLMPLEQRDAFALSLRLFLQNNEEISIGNISELINRLPLPEKFKEIWNRQRNNFNTFLDSPPEFFTDIKSNRDLVDTILYGDLAHLNRKKREKVKLFNSDPEIGIPAYAHFFYNLRNIMFYLTSCREGAVKAIQFLSKLREA